MTPDLLVETDWLTENLEDPGLRVVDIRGYVRKTDLGDGHQKCRVPRRPRGV